MIHFVEKTWGIHFAKGGTGALIDGFVRKFQDLGGELRCDAPVAASTWPRTAASSVGRAR